MMKDRRPSPPKNKRKRPDPPGEQRTPKESNVSEHETEMDTSNQVAPQEQPAQSSDTNEHNTEGDNQGYNRRNNRITLPHEDEVEATPEFIVVMEFEELDKDILKCPEKIQEAIEASPIVNIPTVNLKQNHARGMLVFFLENESHANQVLRIHHFGNKSVTCRLSKDSNIHQGVIGPISCPLEKTVAENKVKTYMTMMKNAGNPVKSMQWIITKDDTGRQRTTDNMLIEFEKIAPEQVLIGTIPYRVRPYIREPTQCYNCQHFGHVSKFCHSQCRCVFCGERGHRKSEKKCRTYSPRCCNCGGRHQAYSKRCPNYQREKVALIIKGKTNTTLFNARDLADKQHYPYLQRQRDSNSSATAGYRRDSTSSAYERDRRDSSSENARQRRDSSSAYARQRRDSSSSAYLMQRNSTNRTYTDRHRNYYRRDDLTYANAATYQSTRDSSRNLERRNSNNYTSQERTNGPINQNQQSHYPSNLSLPPPLREPPKEQREARRNQSRDRTNTND